MSATSAKSAAIAKQPEDDIVGRTLYQIDAVNDLFRKAERQCHLIASSTRVAELLPGCGVAMSAVHVDPNVDQYGSGRDCYRLPGGALGFRRHVMDQISSALGIDWDPRESRRTDDNRTPNYWSYKAVGHYRALDGSLRSLQDEYDLDLRDDSPRVREALDKANAQPANQRQAAIEEAWKGIRSMRKFGLSRCITGARQRAAASVGIRRSYQPAELDRPFIVAKLSFTGQYDDPETQRAVAGQVAQAFLGGTRSLYTTPAGEPVRALPTRGAVIEHQQDDEPEQPTAPQHAAPPAAPPAKAFTLPRTNTPLDKATPAELERWERRIGEDLADNLFDGDEVAHYVELRDAITEELKRRGSASQSQGTQPRGGF